MCRLPRRGQWYRLKAPMFRSFSATFLGPGTPPPTSGLPVTPVQTYPSPRCATNQPFRSWIMSEECENQLHACQKCRLRKVKCDRQAPKCTNCAKGSVACIVVDPITGEQYARDYVRQLEEKERDLTRRLDALDDAGVVTPVSTERSEGSHPTPVGPETAASSGAQSGFVGDGSGLGFLQSILSDI